MGRDSCGAQPRRAAPGALPRDRQGALGGARPQPDEGQRARGARARRWTRTGTREAPADGSRCASATCRAPCASATPSSAWARPSSRWASSWPRAATSSRPTSRPSSPSCRTTCPRCRGTRCVRASRRSWARRWTSCSPRSTDAARRGQHRPGVQGHAAGRHAGGRQGAAPRRHRDHGDRPGDPRRAGAAARGAHAVGQGLRRRRARQEFADVLRSELDYTHEGRAMDRFRAAFADTPEVSFPDVYWDHTTSRVLTMDFIDGVPATKLESGDVPGVDRAAVVDTGVAATCARSSSWATTTPTRTRGTSSRSATGASPSWTSAAWPASRERNRDAMFDMLLAVFDDDPRAATEAVLTMTGMPPHVDVATMEMELGACWPPTAAPRPPAAACEDLMQRLLTLMREHRLHLPTELTVLLTTLGMVDGVARQIDPDFRLVDAVSRSRASWSRSSSGRRSCSSDAALGARLRALLRRPAGAADARAAARRARGSSASRCGPPSSSRSWTAWRRRSRGWPTR